jgi:hypothetical protein
MARFWISWHQPTADHRPLTYPPHPQVLGWWKSGYDSDDVAQLCGWIEAESEDMAKTYIRISWPEAERWRFAEQVADDWRPTDRFPLASWMRERLVAPAPAEGG